MKIRLVILLMVWAMAAPVAAQPVELAQGGEARWPVIVSESAEAAVQEAAKELAEQLGRISGAEFEIQTATAPGNGIVIAALGDFETLPGQDALRNDDPTRREEYILRSHDDGLHLIGATELGVAHAVWDVLYRLGHRQFLPGARWEIVPTLDRIELDVDVHEAPDFVYRWLWPGGGYFNYDRQANLEWDRRNRTGRGFRVGNSHIYDRIVRDRRDAFEQHPEYLALIDGERREPRNTGNKFCLSNAELRRLCVEWAIAYLEARPGIDGVSMEPSDGMGWCECEPCAEMGGISDRVVMLASEVAEALEAHFPTPLYVGLLAYAGHSPPPSIDAHPRVVVSVANGYLRGGWRFEELLRFWGERSAMMGVYDYLGVVQWSWARPGRGRATRRSYAATRIPRMHELGVRLYTGERDGNWATSGLGYYLVARVLWDVDEAHRVDELVEEFLTLSFGEAREPMARYFELIDGEPRPLLSRDLVGRMYRLLDEARGQTSAPAVLARLDDLTIYTRYVELYLDYTTGDGEARQEAFETLMRYVWRVRSHMMIHAREIYRQLGRTDRRITMDQAEVGYRVPEERNPWKSSDPVTDDEIAQWLREGIANNPLLAFEQVSYDTDLVPATPLNLSHQIYGTFGGGTQNRQTLYTWVEDADAPIELTVTGGLIRHYRDRGDVRISLVAADAPDDDVLDEARVPPDGEPREVTLRAPRPGLYRIELTDGGDRTSVDWPEGTPMTFWSDAATSIGYPLSWTLHFYVPKGTTSVGGYSSHASGEMRDGDGQVVHSFADEGEPGFFDVPVPPGQDGRLWMLRRCRGQRLLMTVPPALARSAEELLLPRDVVERDR